MRRQSIKINVGIYSSTACSLGIIFTGLPDSASGTEIFFWLGIMFLITNYQWNESENVGVICWFFVWWLKECVVAVFLSSLVVMMKSCLWHTTMSTTSALWHRQSNWKQWVVILFFSYQIVTLKEKVFHRSDHFSSFASINLVFVFFF